IGRIFIKNSTDHFQILLFKQAILSRLADHKNGIFDEHIVIKRSLNLNAEKLSKNDYLLVSEKKVPSIKKRRSLNGKPLILNVEVLAVLDSSIYDEHKHLRRTDPLRDIIGISYQGQVCYDFRSSLVEDDFSFKSIYTIAHEIGHNLDLKHDGDQGTSSCNAADGFLMTSSFNFDNMTNAGLFSPCSISTLKSSLIDQNGQKSFLK
ncbi:ADAM family mig-17, partial [Brachionus plicatilis]